jgi:hypothetical protein
MLLGIINILLYGTKPQNKDGLVPRLVFACPHGSPMHAVTKQHQPTAHTLVAGHLHTNCATIRSKKEENNQV